MLITLECFGDEAEGLANSGTRLMSGISGQADILCPTSSRRFVPRAVEDEPFSFFALIVGRNVTEQGLSRVSSRR